jgi:hypothetical protein
LQQGAGSCDVIANTDMGRRSPSGGNGSAFTGRSSAFVQIVLLWLARVIGTLGEDGVGQVRLMADTTVWPHNLMEVDQLFVFYERAIHA